VFRKLARSWCRKSDESNKPRMSEDRALGRRVRRMTPELEDLEPKIALSGMSADTPMAQPEPPTNRPRMVQPPANRPPAASNPPTFPRPLPPHLHPKIGPVDEEEVFTSGPIINILKPPAPGETTNKLLTPEQRERMNVYLGVNRWGLIIPNIETIDWLQPIWNATNGPMLEYVILRDPEDYEFWFDLDELFPHEPISRIVQTPDGPKEELFPWITHEQIIYYLVVPSLRSIPF